MSIFDQPSESRPREIPPADKYPALLTKIIDLGTHTDTYEGVERLKHELELTWELVGSKMEDGRPFFVSVTYTMTNGKFGPYFAKTSNIFKMLKAWTGKDEKVCKNVRILGELVRSDFPATITVEHQESKKVGLDGKPKVYANIESIKPYKGKEKLVRVNDPVFFSIGGDYSALPAWQQEKIKSSLELNGGVPKREDAPAIDHTDFDESIPF